VVSTELIPPVLYVPAAVQFSARKRIVTPGSQSVDRDLSGPFLAFITKREKERKHAEDTYCSMAIYGAFAWTILVL